MNRLNASSFVVLLTFALIICVCDRDTKDTNNRNTIDFSVDGDAVSYLYRHPSGGLHRVERLEDIPLEHRVAVIVVTSTVDSPPFDAREYPVADLLDAQPGDRETATWISKKRFVRANLASTYGHERAHEVRFWAQEITQLAPNSERSRASDRALRLLEETEPPPQPSTKQPDEP